MNGSHIFAVNVLLGARNAWPQPPCAQASTESADA